MSQWGYGNGCPLDAASLCLSLSSLRARVQARNLGKLSGRRRSEVGRVPRLLPLTSGSAAAGRGGYSQARV